MSTTSRQQDGEQPVREAGTDQALEPPDEDEPVEEETRIVIKVERTQSTEAWVTAQEFCGCLAGHSPCKECQSREK